MARFLLSTPPDSLGVNVPFWAEVADPPRVYRRAWRGELETHLVEVSFWTEASGGREVIPARKLRNKNGDLVVQYARRRMVVARLIAVTFCWRGAVASAGRRPWESEENHALRVLGPRTSWWVAHHDPALL